MSTRRGLNLNAEKTLVLADRSRADGFLSYNEPGIQLPNFSWANIYSCKPVGLRLVIGQVVLIMFEPVAYSLRLCFFSPSPMPNTITSPSKHQLLDGVPVMF